ncbi:MAG: NAD+ synthase [Candidatus Eisenbacteria sp.]|nr:NAD+ synthase [Candidatus Eisenbacteria bacterium]
MKIALAQIDPTVGDFEGNLRHIRQALKDARAGGADLCLFPELCLTGYPPHDLLERPRFVEQNLEALDALRPDTADIAAVVGFVGTTADGVGKGLYNSAALLAEGQVVSVHSKTLLPTYDVFDERRYFEPASRVRPVEFRGIRLGISICEDMWNVPDFWPRRMYEKDPVRDLVNQGADILINISASPFTLEKRRLRPEMLKAAALNYGRPLFFVNQVGGNDDLVFDGHSLAFGPDGALWARGREFGQDLIVVDTDAGTGEIRDLCPSDEAAALEALVLGTRDYAHKCGFQSAVLGLSGGIDSALTAAIGARALGPGNIHGIAMSSRYTSDESVRDARAIAEALGIHLHFISIDDIFEVFLRKLAPVFGDLEPDVTEENLQARVRGVLLMALSNKFGHLLLTTGNKSELATGYCTLYGDMAGGLAVLADVPKTMVYRICEELNRQDPIIPRSVIDKPPSAELRPDQTDQDSLPPYDVLDQVLEYHIEERMDLDRIVERGFDRTLVEDVLRLVRVNEYKRRQSPPVLKITSKAFGPGRRMPIAQRWNG